MAVYKAARREPDPSRNTWRSQRSLENLSADELMDVLALIYAALGDFREAYRYLGKSFADPGFVLERRPCWRAEFLRKGMRSAGICF